MRFALVLIIAALVVLPAAAAQNTTTVTPVKSAPKDRGTPTSSQVTITLQSPTSALFTQDQTWEGRSADEFRQSLDAYFGNGDGQVSADEAAKLINASESEMQNKSFPSIGMDGNAATVTAVTVTLDGVVGAANGTPASLHHNATLTLTPGANEAHTITVTPLWDGSITVVAPDGMIIAVGDAANGQPSASVVGSSKTSQTFTLRAAPPTPTPQPTAQSVVTPTAPVNTTPQESTGPAPRSKLPDVGVIGAALAVLAAALVARQRSRR